MKIAFIGQKGIPTAQGGIEKHVQELSIRLAKAGLNAVVYCRPHYTKNHNKNFQSVRLINLPSINTKRLDAITHTFFSTLHALFQDYDIIHYHGVGPSLLSWIPRIFKPKTKVVATFHCIDRQHQKWGPFSRLFLRLGEWTICHFPHRTIAVSKTLKKYCQFNKCAAIYIPNGVTIDRSKTKSNILTECKLTKNNYFLVVSRLVRHKGIHTLIRAFNKIKTKKKLVIVGASAKTNDYADYLKILAKDNKNIIFTGQKEKADLRTLFENAFLFIQPSEAEGLSIALLEAISYGLPVISSDIEENMEIIGSLGLRFKNKNSNDLKKQLAFSLKNPKLIRTMAIKAKKHVDLAYNWDNIAKKIIKVYQEASLPEPETKKHCQD